MLNTGFEGTQRRYDTAIYDKHILPNGITAWIQKPPIITDDEGILIACFPTVGAIRDPIGKEGIAHFFEHIPFRGTLRKPSRQELVDPINAMGGDWNATTSQYWTKYFVGLPLDLYPLAVETVFEMSTSPLIRDEDVLLERGVIAQECKNLMADPNLLLRVHLDRRAFGNHPMAHHVVGTPESIAAMTPDDLRAFQAKWYHARNLHLVVGGAFTERNDVLALIECTFGSIPASGEIVPLPDFPEIIEQNIELRDPRYGRDSFTLAWMLPRPEEDWDYPIQILAGAIGDGQHTPLVSALREKMGATYDSHLTKAVQTPNPYPFCFRIFVRLGEENFDQAHELALKTIREISPDRIIAEHVKRQRGRCTNFTHPIKECHNAVDEILINGYPVPYRDAEIRNDSLTLDQVLAWRDYLVNHNPIIVRAIAK